MPYVWTTPCDNANYMASFGLQVDPWDLDRCVECEMCGGCLTHLCYRDPQSILGHADWFMPFPAYGEPECGELGGPAHLVPSSYPPEACNLAPLHEGRHRTRAGWFWEQQAAPARVSVAGQDGGQA